MRIATWNVNSLPARLERVLGWLDRAKPDVLLVQETKVSDAAAPRDAFRAKGYTLVHHGEGRWNGVAIASRLPVTQMVTNFGEPLAERIAGGTDDQPLAEARMIGVTIDGIRVVSLYAPNGRTLDSPFYLAKLVWLDRLVRWVEETRSDGSADPDRSSADPHGGLVIGGDFNVTPADLDVWDPAKCHGGTHVSPAERDRIDRLVDLGLVDAYRRLHPEGDRYSWWDYRAGMFYKNHGMRIDLLLASPSVAERLVWAEIDREARKGKPTPSDHAPVVLDLDAPGEPLDAGWSGADARIAARRASAGRKKGAPTEP